MEVRTKFAVDDIVEYDGRTAKVVKVELYEDVHNEVNYYIDFDNGERYIKHDVDLKLISRSNNKHVVELKTVQIGKYYIIETFKHYRRLVVAKLISIDTDLIENGEIDKERVTYKGILEFVNGERKHMRLTGCEPLSNIDDYFFDSESLRDNINEWKEKGIYLYTNSFLTFIKHLFRFRRY